MDSFVGLCQLIIKKKVAATRSGIWSEKEHLLSPMNFTLEIIVMTKSYLDYSPVM